MRLSVSAVLSFAACAADRPDILLITLDTTRADALGCYGAQGDPTPNLDAVAARGVLAEEVMATAPLTLPAHTSVLSGLYPDRHGIRDNGRGRYSETLPSLPSTLHSNGWQTGAFVSAAVLDHAFGLDHGFDTYEDHFDELPVARLAVVPQWDGSIVVERALSWLEGREQNAPVFAWVHLYDAHLPREVPLLFGERFPTDAYQAEVAELDMHVASLLHGWAARRDSPLILAIIGDHGESNGEHHELTHGWFTYRSTLRVPLILAGPGIPQGETITSGVSATDLAPTLLDLVDLQPDRPMDGCSLRSSWDSEIPDDPRALYAESWNPRYGFGVSELRAIQLGTQRAILAPRPELFDWIADPGETENLALDTTRWAPWADRFADWSKRRGEPEVNGVPLASSELSAQLSTLGYVNMVPSIEANLHLDPKDFVNLPELWSQVMGQARSLPPAEGLAVLDALLNEHPQVSSAVLLRARALSLVGRSEEALAILSPMADTSDANPDLIAQVAELEQRLGRVDAGRRRIGVALQAYPWHPGLRVVLASGFLLEGRPADCVASANAAIDRSPRSSALHYVRAVCYLDGGNDAAAGTDLETVIEIDPGHREARTPLALIRVRAGDVSSAESLLETQLTISPEDREARAALGQIATIAGDWERALELLAPIWEHEELGPDPAHAWAATIEALGRPSQLVKEARVEALRRSGKDTKSSQGKSLQSPLKPKSASNR